MTESRRPASAVVRSASAGTSGEPFGVARRRKGDDPDAKYTTGIDWARARLGLVDAARYDTQGGKDDASATSGASVAAAERFALESWCVAGGEGGGGEKDGGREASGAAAGAMHGTEGAKLRRLLRW